LPPPAPDPRGASEESDAGHWPNDLPIDPALTAEAVAFRLLSEPMPRRWTHVGAVAGKAAMLSSLLPADQRPTLVAAAWLHDIGYAPGVASSGLHSLDGARWLAARGFDPAVVNLVAYHSCAVFEARERGLTLDEFTFQPSLAADLLWVADMTTGPDGQDFSIEARLADIRTRYGPSHVVTRFWVEAEPTLREAVARVDAISPAAVQRQSPLATNGSDL
jgi:HD domain